MVPISPLCFMIPRSTVPSRVSPNRGFEVALECDIRVTHGGSGGLARRGPDRVSTSPQTRSTTGDGRQGPTGYAPFTRWPGPGPDTIVTFSDGLPSNQTAAEQLRRLRASVAPARQQRFPPLSGLQEHGGEHRRMEPGKRGSSRYRAGGLVGAILALACLFASCLVIVAVSDGDGDIQAPPPTPLPTLDGGSNGDPTAGSLCGHAEALPRAAARPGWDGYRCRRPRPGCLARLDYAEHHGHGCPGELQCCPPPGQGR